LFVKSALRIVFVLAILLFAIGAPALAQETLTAEGAINNNTPSETYDLDLAIGDIVTITTEVTSGNLDTTLSLTDPTGRVIATNDDRGDGTYNSQIIYVAERAGEYVITISRYDDSTRGEYDLTVQFGADAAQPASQTSSDANDSLEGEGRLDDTVQSETYEIDLDRGHTVTITTDATSGNLDTVLFLFDQNGNEVATNDDIERGNLNSQIVYTAVSGGTYTIEVTRYDDTSRGDYTITVVVDSPTGTTTQGGTTTPVEEEQQVFSGTGTINDSIQSENWELPLDAGSIVVIDVNKTSGNLDTTATLIAPNGQEVAFNDDRGDGTLNSEIIYEVEDGGIYTVIVEGYDDTTEGDYEIIVSIDPNATPDFSFVDVDGNTLAQGTGSIQRDEDEFDFDVNLTQGQSVYASVEATSGDLDTILSLYAPDGSLVAINDDRGDGTLNSALAYTAESSGTYTFVVTRYDGSDSTGSFAFIAQQVDAEVVQEIEDTSNQALSLSGPTETIETDHFRIYYTLAGSDATTEEYVRAFAETLEEMYDAQINRIGWAAPPAGEDGLYEAYLADVIGADFGALAYARPMDVVGDNPNTERIETRAADAILVVDNDYVFDGSDVNPQTLMRASTTHEFNHLIQFGYDYDEELFWAFEATAVWTETVTVGDEQDATGYIEQNNEYPELCFATEEFDGSLAYGDWTLLEVIADRYGEGAILRIWENAIEYEGLDIITQTLDELGTSLPEMISVWRARNLVIDYELGALFPRPVWLENTIDEFGDWSAEGNGIQEMGANYFTLDLNGEVNLELNGSNTLELWVVGINGDVAEAFQLGESGTVDLSAYSDSYAMVVSTEQPDDLGSCSFLDYSISVSGGGTPITTPTLMLNAENHQRLR
jgi:hypothetical protein